MEMLHVTGIGTQVLPRGSLDKRQTFRFKLLQVSICPKEVNGEM